MSHPSTNLLSTTGSGPRGIPQAIFIEDIQNHVGGPETEIETSLRSWQEMIGKYQFMEKNSLQKKIGFEDKIPELQRNLEAVELLKKNKEDDEVLETHFELADTLYAHAIVKPVQEVYLWLGANTMLAYPLDEAETLLLDKIENVKKLEETNEEIRFLRDQITTCQVNIARVFNWDVKRRKTNKIKNSN